jgi:hypothetical protein
LLLLLLQAYPKGACIKNNANLLPLHIAIRARASAKWLSELVRVYPESINALTPNGQSILELAIQSSVSAEAIKVLQQARMKMAPEPEQDYEQEQQNHLQYHQQQQKQQQSQKATVPHTNGKFMKGSSGSSFAQEPTNHLVSPVSMGTSSNTLDSFESSKCPHIVPALFASSSSLQQPNNPNNQIDHGTDAIKNGRILGQRKFSLDHLEQATRAENKSRFIQSSGGRASRMIGGRHQSLPLLPSFEELRLQEQQRIRKQHEDDDSEEDDDMLQSRRRETRSGMGSIRIENMPFESPPEWKLDDECSICRASFGVFKHRHHCRNCGKSICRQHSADKKIIMTNKGFTTPQRVCVTCYGMITHSRYSKSNQRQHYEEENENFYGVDDENVYDQSDRSHSALLKSTRSFRHISAASMNHSITNNNLTTSLRKSSIHKLHAAAAATSAAIHSSIPGIGAGGGTGISSNGLTSLTQDKAEIYLLQAQVSDLNQVVSSLQRQVQSLTQSNMNMQQQILEHEEVKAETMLLITQLMTRVSVLELQKSQQEEEEEEEDGGGKEKISSFKL